MTITTYITKKNPMRQTYLSDDRFLCSANGNMKTTFITTAQKGDFSSCMNSGTFGNRLCIAMEIYMFASFVNPTTIPQLFKKNISLTNMVKDFPYPFAMSKYLIFPDLLEASTNNFAVK